MNNVGLSGSYCARASKRKQAALLLASLALVPERLSSAVGSELRNSLVRVAQRWKVPAETINKPW